ncbi:MAG: hypothetical protein V4604_06140 [Bacteroidota bacterium]
MMLPSLLIALIAGRIFFGLARKNNRSEWGIGALGAGVFVVAQLLFTVGFGAYLGLSDNLEILQSPQWLARITLMSLGFAFLVSWLVYYLLKRSWKKKAQQPNKDNLIDQ